MDCQIWRLDRIGLGCGKWGANLLLDHHQALSAGRVCSNTRDDGRSVLCFRNNDEPEIIWA